MGILIRGMKMQTSCERCPMLDWDLDYIKCKVTDRHFKMTEYWRSIRVPDCPLVPIPPHGKCIDAEKIYDAVEQRYRMSSGIEHRCERDLLDLICAAPTIISAEPKEEETK